MPEPWPERPWPEAVPRFVTPRNHSRLTLGPEVAQVARDLGFEPMPWNTDNWDTMYEYTVDAQGRKRLWYREARITVPRQSAKTTATLVRQTHRCRYGEGHGWGARQVCAFTAQHASDARDKVVNEWMPTIEYGPFAPTWEEEGAKILRSNGREGFKWRNGSRMITFPPNATGAHGQTLDEVDIDEAFAFVDNKPEQGARHAMITRKSPQIVIQSTAGTAESAYFKGKVDDGRRRVEAGEDTHVYYVEYSVGPDDDIDNPAHWPRWMPALGYTIDVEAVLLEHDALDADEFYRAYGNGWTGSGNQIIPAVHWAQCYSPKSRREGKVWMSVDASPGSSGQGRSGSVSVASYRDDGIHVEVVAHGPGVMWLPAKIKELTRQTTVQSLWLDPAGPIGQILSDIQDVSMANVEVVDARTMAAACGRFHQACLDHTVRHRDQDMLNAAVQGADKRVLEDAWAWKRRTSTADISPLVTATLAHWAAAIEGNRGLITMHTGA